MDYELLRHPDSDQEQNIQLTAKWAYVVPFFASIGILLMFYFFSVMSLLLFISCLFSASVGIYMALLPVVERMPHFHKIVSVKSFECKFGMLLAGLVSGGIVLSWTLTSNPVLNNLMAIGLCVLSVSVLRVPNFKTVTVLFWGLFLYDIFWVFGSSYFFGENVMEAVASQKATNPVHAVASTFHLPAVEELDLPMKFICFDMILGLGDVSLPAMIVSLAMRYGKASGNQPFWNSYTFYGFSGYCLGLAFTMLFVVYFRIGQPALLYIVPCTYFPILYISYTKGQLKHFWNQGVPNSFLPL